jgi:hypothetical protein
MVNSYFSASEHWEDLNQCLATFTKATANRCLPPISTLPTLRHKMISYLQICLAKWEQIDNCVHPNVPANKKWAFDRIGNILRTSLIELQNPKATGEDLAKLNEELNLAKGLCNQVDKEFFWFTTVMMMPDSSLLVNSWSSRSRFHKIANSSLARNREEAMSNYVTELRKTLGIHEKNAIDLRKYIALNPFEPSLKRRYEMEVDNYHSIAKTLKAKGEKIVDVFQDEPKDDDTYAKAKPVPRPETVRTYVANVYDPSSDRSSGKTEPRIIDKKAGQGGVASIRNSLVECLSIFKKSFTIDAHEQLKNAIEARFEVLLLQVNSIIDDIEQKGDDSYNLLEAAKMLDMSIHRLRQAESAGKSIDISSFLNVAIDMLG